MSSAPSLVLIGFMATGKSTVGRQCADALGLRFRDSDSLVERRARMTIAQIFAEHGEAAFRTMEVEAIRTLAAARPIVLATGGGAPMSGLNVARLRRAGIVVLLWASPEEIALRAGAHGRRPLLSSAENPADRIRELLNQREPAYRAAADMVIDTTGLQREETVSRVLSAYREKSHGWCSERRGRAACV